VFPSGETRHAGFSDGGAQVANIGRLAHHSTTTLSPNNDHMPLKPITSDRLAKPVGPFSPAVRDRDRVYTSGQVAQDPATGKLIEGSVAAQTEQIFHNLTVILEAADKTLADVVKVNVYLTDIKRFTEMNEVYARHFVAPYPARTTVAVAALPLNAEVEIEMIAG
jgi:2-iminobutanoate/2-iminopropanoate deaminase